MTTAHSIINSALRRILVLASEEEMSAAEAVDALKIMNTMMSGFGPKGIYYVHKTLGLEDTVNMPDELEESLILMLCNSLADEFGAQIGQKLAMDIMDAKHTLQAAYYVTRPAVTDPLLRSRAYFPRT